MSDNLAHIVDQNICEKWSFTISELSCDFPQISLTVHYKITRVRLDYNKFCARWVLKMLMGVHKMQRMAFGFDFLE
jgi:hypothetical protein